KVTALIESAKTKDITYTRISRALMHLLLDIKEDDYLKLKTQPCPYIRVLGFNDAGQKYLASVKKDIACPIIVKPADYKDELKQDIYASDIYNMILSHKSGTETVSDYKRQTR
ncbi:MAG: nucleotidyltransferase family protein, partial [Lachnospiraceae bacterium]